MSYRNLARKGPKRVWEDGYRNLRVPVAIFDDVKLYMEKQKQDFLAGLEGLSKESSTALYAEEDISSMSPEVQQQIPAVLRQIIQEEFRKIKSSSGIGDVGNLTPRKKTAKERIKDILMEYEGEQLSTIQIGDLLNMPPPTCRQASRELASEDPSIIQFEGRPNRYLYKS